MNELALRTTEMFGEVKTNIYENESHEMFMTAEQLGECLGYSNPRESINKLVQRNEYLRKTEFSDEVRLTSTDGKRYWTRVFNEDGIYEVTFLSKTKKALEFHHWVRNLLKALRKGDMQLAMGNVTFSQDMFEAALAKYFGGLNDRVTALESKPNQPNYWLWKKHIVSGAIDNLSKTLNIDTRAAYDLVYANMGGVYGFDKSFAINQFCVKYGVETAPVIDVIADCPQYQSEFIQAINNLLDKVISQGQAIKQLPPTDKVQSVINPLIKKLGDKSVNGARTYGKVYSMMATKRVWKSLFTRYRCSTKKQVLMKNDRKYKQFVDCVNKLMREEV